MRRLGLWAVRPKRNTSKRHPEHKVYPYLLRGKTIDQPNDRSGPDEMSKSRRPLCRVRHVRAFAVFIGRSPDTELALNPGRGNK